MGASYDAAGNLTGDGTTSYTYDALSRLAAQGTTTFAYNADGVLVAQASGGATTRYAQDLAAPLSQVLQVGATDYIYGAGRIAALGGTSTTWYAADALGSVRGTLDAAGDIHALVSYDPWGQVERGTVPTFGFTGELQQGDQVYLRARWYNAARGGFGSVDPFAGASTSPDSFAPYMYAYNQPTLLIDPSGRYSVDEDKNTMQAYSCETPVQSSSSISMPDEKTRYNSDEILLSQCLSPIILKYARIHAMPGDGFNKNALAALMAAIIQMENGDPSFKDFSNRFLSPIYNHVLNGNSTVGVAKLRPQTIEEIYNCNIPMTEDRYLSVDLSPTYFSKDNIKLLTEDSDGIYDSWNNAFFSAVLSISDEFSIEMLAINLKSGILRAKAEGIKPSVLNLATWHNTGVQHANILLLKGTYSYGVSVALELLPRAAKNIGVSLPEGLNYYNTDEKKLVDRYYNRLFFSIILK